MESWAPEGMGEEEFQAKKRQYDLLVEKTMSHTTTVLWFTRGRTGPPRNLRGGSIFFVDLGAGPIAITAAHVFLGYREVKSQVPKLVCQVSGRVLDLEERVIDCNTSLDLATFHIDPDEVSTREVKKVAQDAISSWPSEPPTEGEAVFICGFPRRERALLSDDALVVGLGSLLVFATGVTERQITCRWDYAELSRVLGRKITRATNLGGLSGGPIWRQRSSNPDELELVAVVTEANSRLGMLCATRADYIDASGKIRPPMMGS